MKKTLSSYDNKQILDFLFLNKILTFGIIFQQQLFHKSLLFVLTFIYIIFLFGQSHTTRLCKFHHFKSLTYFTGY